MAKKFFNQKIPNKNKSIAQIIIISICVIGVIICFFIANHFSNKPKNNPNAIIELRDSVAIEINGELPEKTTYFAELQNVNEDDIIIDHKNVDLSTAGDYKVTVEINNKLYEVILKVIDTDSPVLKTKDVSIRQGSSYKAEDFVQNCSDNSQKQCKISFYTSAVNQDGEKINYANYKDAGEYTVQIVAEDPSGNISSPITAKLTIGSKNNPPEPTICKFGNKEYDNSKYILATYVTENNCAIDLNLYHDANVRNSVEKIMQAQTKKLQQEFAKLNITQLKTLNRKSEAVLNIAGTGIVGYTLHMEVIITNDDKTNEVAASFYVD